MGCFNMSCAITNMPIMCGDKMVVALAGEGSQLNVKVLPMFFEAEYNDYGTFENADTDSFGYKWFMRFIKSPKTEEHLQSIVRDGIEREVEEIEYPYQYDVSGARVIFVLKSVWDEIVTYQTNMCSGSFYYHNPQYTRRPDIKQRLTDSLRCSDRLNKLEGSDNLSNSSCCLQQELLELMAKSFRMDNDHHNVGPDIIKHIFSYCQDNKIDCDDFVPMYSDTIEQSSDVSSFANSINSNLNSRYAGQDSNDEYYDVLIGAMRKRMMAVRERWDEDYD